MFTHKYVLKLKVKVLKAYTDNIELYMVDVYLSCGKQLSVLSTCE